MPESIDAVGVFANWSQSNNEAENLADENSAQGLAKWPFWLIDAICIAIGVTIVSRAGEVPAMSSLLAALGFILVGAAAFVFPYIAEYVMRLKLLAGEFENARLDAAKQQAFALKQLEQQANRLVELASRVEVDLRVGESIADRIESEAVTFLKEIETLRGLEHKIEALRVDAEGQGADFRGNFQNFGEQLSGLRELCEEIQKASDNSAANPTQADETAAQDISSVLEGIETLASEIKMLKQHLPGLSRPRSGRSLDRGMLKRAIRDGEDSPETSTPAVNRIIHQRGDDDAERSDLKSDAEEFEEASTVENVDTPEQTPQQEAPREVKRTEEARSDDTVLSASEDKEQAGIATDPKTAPSSTGREAPASSDKPEPPDDSGATPLFPSLPPSPSRVGKAKAGETAVLARVLIGIGNKPYIRGDLPGLSWEHGIAMDFREVGLWQWTSSHVDAPGSFCIYRNDKDPDKGGQHTITPGQKLEIQPQF